MNSKQFYLSTLLTLTATAAIGQPQCKIISFDHFGGNKNDVIRDYGLQSYKPADNFNLYTGTMSTTGSVYTDCTAEVGGGTVVRCYSGDYSKLISESCALKGSNFVHETPFYYPQPGGNTILIGYTDDFGSNDIAIEGRSATGEILWNKHYGGSGTESASKVALAPDGSFFVLTGTNSNDGDVGFHYGSGFDADMWVVKLDTAGNKVWSKVLGGTGFDLLSTIIPSTNGGCYLFGATTSDDYDATGSHGGTDVWVVKLDSDGNKEWHKMLGGSLTDGSGYDNGIRAIPDSGGGFYVLARTNSHDGDIQQRIPMGAEDLWLLHIDSFANILWENTYGGPGVQSSRALCRGADGSIWMAGKLIGDSVGGHISTTYRDTDGWVAHVDSNGNFLNQRTIGANLEEEIIIMQPLTDGTVLAVGRYESIINPTMPKTPGFPESGDGDIDVFIARLSPDNDIEIIQPAIAENDWVIDRNTSGKKVVVTLPKEGGPYAIAIYNTEGLEMANRVSGISSVSFSTTKLPPGTYTIMLTDKAGQSSSKKVTVRH